MMPHYYWVLLLIGWNKFPHMARPIRSSTQIWVVTHHQYGTSVVVTVTDAISWGNQWWYHKMLAVFSDYSRTPLFRTWLIRSPRYFEGRSNSLGFTLMFSVIYYQLFRTRLFRIPRYFELIVLSLHLKINPVISNLSKTEYEHKSTAGNVLHFIWARVA